MIMNGTATRSSVPLSPPPTSEVLNWNVHLMNPNEPRGATRLPLYDFSSVILVLPGNHVARKVEGTRVRCHGAWEELTVPQSCLQASTAYAAWVSSLVQSAAGTGRSSNGSVAATCCAIDSLSPWYKWPLFDLKERQGGKWGPHASFFFFFCFGEFNWCNDKKRAIC